MSLLVIEKRPVGASPASSQRRPCRVALARPGKEAAGARGGPPTPGAPPIRCGTRSRGGTWLLFVDSSVAHTGARRNTRSDAIRWW